MAVPPGHPRRPLVLLGVFACLPGVAGEGSRSLVPIRPRAATEHRTNEHHDALVGLHEGRRGGIRVVRVTRTDDWEDDISDGTVESKKRRSYPLSHIKSAALTVSLFGLLIRNLYFTSLDQHSWGLVLLVGLLYLLESFFSSTRRYLSNIMAPLDVMDYVRSLQKSAPRIRWDVECYHYRADRFASRRRHDTSNTNTKVVTHRAHRNFWFQQWKDVTPMDKLRSFLECDPEKRETYVKVTLTKLVLFADTVYYQNYLAQQAAFFVTNANRDVYNDSSTTIEVEGHVPKLLAVRTVLGGVGPMQLSFYWFFTLLGLTVPYRMWFSRHCDDIEVVLTKEVAT